MLVQVPPGVVHVVERLAPGGIETFVLDMLRSGSPADRVFSLQETLPHLLSRWPTLYEFSDRIDAFEKNPGLQIGLIPRITARLRALRPQAVIVHHIGPLIYGGIAARLAGVALRCTCPDATTHGISRTVTPTACAKASPSGLSRSNHRWGICCRAAHERSDVEF